MASNLSIVLVEDNDDLRELTCRALQALGHRATGLSCAEELEDTAFFDVDLFIFDLTLPGEDGIQLTRRVRAAHPDAIIIILTARIHSNDAVLGYESGANAYLKKPISIHELSACINGFFRNKNATKSQFLLNGIRLSGGLGNVRLSSNDSNLLASFARSPNQFLEFWQISQILGINPDNLNKLNLAVRIDRLRKKISEAGRIDMPIESVRLLGYRITFALIVTQN